ncbi:MAG: tetraacyldisaccharide 4'-kinase [Pseudomonadota bacterium]|nr:tetraacyldisaccharide 4'-kinase [Pseudomonadota bacterium]
MITVASLSRGGTGKTPMVIALAQRLGRPDREVHVLMRGTGPALRVEERRHTADDVGDEPLLSAAFTPTWVGADMVETARAAIEAGAQLLIVEEDGVAEIASDARILVEDAVRGFGNGRVWPFGSLREPIRRGLAKADLLVTVGSKKAQDSFQTVPIPRTAARLDVLQTGMSWSGLPVLAFAGIGVPERFFATLHDLGANVVRAQALADHQEMTPTLLARLEREAAMAGAQMVTTEKDAVRLPPAFRPKVLVLPVRLELDDWGTVDKLMQDRQAG